MLEILGISLVEVARQEGVSMFAISEAIDRKMKDQFNSANDVPPIFRTVEIKSFVLRVFWPSPYHDFSIGTGRPTRMKNLANACDRCSLYGGSRRNLARFRCTSRDSRKERGIVKTS